MLTTVCTSSCPSSTNKVDNSQLRAPNPARTTFRAKIFRRFPFTLWFANLSSSAVFPSFALSDESSTDLHRSNALFKELSPFSCRY